MSDGLPVWWVSWYDDPSGPPGKMEESVTSWVTGYDASDREIRCARVPAKTEEEAWAKVDVMFPGASSARRRFSDQQPAGWWPPSDRFPPPSRKRSA